MDLVQREPIQDCHGNLQVRIRVDGNLDALPPYQGLQLVGRAMGNLSTAIDHDNVVC